MTAAPPITLALVEDDPDTRARLSAAIAADPGQRLLHAAAGAVDMLAWLRDNVVDVLLVDLGLPDGSGLDVIAMCRARWPTTDIMVITMFGDEAHMFKAFEAGARGYLLKDGTESELVRHVQNLHAGGSPMTPVIARRLLERLSHPQPVAAEGVAGGRVDLAVPISAREREILNMLARGYTYHETGNLLGIAVSTVQTHVKNLYGKLAVRSKAEAIFEARHLGLL
jgi:DNA-binding NarL/FixJ family response regulator